MSPFYQLDATSLRGQPISMADYAGKLVLVARSDIFAPITTTPEKTEAAILVAL